MGPAVPVYMAAHSRETRLIPAALVAAVLVTALAAAVLAGPGVAPEASAASNCPYGVCPQNNGGLSLTTIEAIIGLLAVVAVVLGVLIWRDRRRSGGRPPPSEWAAGGGAAAPPPGSAAYTETPEDVSVPPPELPATAGAGGAAEGDIDSLMAELDRISGEILKQGPKGKKGPDGAPSDETPKTDGD